MRSESEIQVKISEMQLEIRKLEALREQPISYDPTIDFPPPEPKEYYDEKIGEIQRQVFLLQWVLGRY